mmetsp:Transcript_48073/g.135322  ORF Transcript_48073/g.135322 Transcript_48073/m.135322 type:complete len:226 (+) Transcript_48073:1246-1923(+)
MRAFTSSSIKMTIICIKSVPTLLNETSTDSEDARYTISSAWHVNEISFVMASRLTLMGGLRKPVLNSRNASILTSAISAPAWISRLCSSLSSWSKAEIALYIEPRRSSIDMLEFKASTISLGVNGGETLRRLGGSWITTLRPSDLFPPSALSLLLTVSSFLVAGFVWLLFSSPWSPFVSLSLLSSSSSTSSSRLVCDVLYSSFSSIASAIFKIDGPGSMKDVVFV